jgi:predicted tellurium resistance membrane protein TerC
MEAEMVPSLSPLLRAADQWHELLLLLPVLVALELVLSADNAIALAAISRRLHDPARQRQALNLGLLLALVLRFLLIFAARWVLSAWPLQLLASAYLLWLCGSHLIGLDQPAGTTVPLAAAPGAGTTTAATTTAAMTAAEPATAGTAGAAMATIEVPGAEPAAAATATAAATAAAAPGLAAMAPSGPGAEPSRPLAPTLARVALTLGLTDLAFSLDSVAAAVAVTDQIALVMLGGLLGVVSLRLTAGLFVRWLELFEHLETAGYLAVGLVGIRLLLRLLLPDLEVPEWGLLLIVAALFLWGFSQRSGTVDAETSGDGS